MTERYLRETVAVDSPLWTDGHRRREYGPGPFDERGRCFFCQRDDQIVVPFDPPELPQLMCDACFDGYEYEHGYLDGIEDVVRLAVAR